MRIVQASFATEFGGAERHAIELANNLASRHDVFFLMPARVPQGSPQFMTLLSPQVKPLFVGAFPTMLLATAAALRRVDPGIVHCHSPRTARAISWLPGRPACVGTLHIRGGAEYRRCDGLICVAAWQRDALRDWKGVSTTIHNWCLPGRALGARERIEIRAGLGAHDGTKVVVAVGRLHRQKRFDVLIEAFAGLKASDVDTQLWIVGSGVEETKLRSLAGAGVHLLGFRDDVDRVLRAADLFVSTSDYEGCPLAVLEAMDARLPLVLTDIPSHREIAGDKAVALVEPGNPAALSIALKRWASDPIAHVEYDLSHFRVERQAAETEAFYENVLRMRRADDVGR